MHVGLTTDPGGDGLSNDAADDGRAGDQHVGVVDRGILWVLNDPGCGEDRLPHREGYGCEVPTENEGLGRVLR